MSAKSVALVERFSGLGQPLRPSIAVAHERGGIALAKTPRPMHMTWPSLEEFVMRCLACSQEIYKGHLDGLDELIRNCATALWCDSKTQDGGTLDDKES